MSGTGLTARAAIVVLADTETGGDLGRVVNALTTARELKEEGDEVAVVFDGAGAKWIPELSDEGHRYHRLLEAVRDRSQAPAPTARRRTASVRAWSNGASSCSTSSTSTRASGATSPTASPYHLLSSLEAAGAAVALEPHPTTAAAGRVLTYDSGMAIDVETEITIARPRSEVAAYASEPDNATAWYANIETAAWETPRPLAVGSRFAFVARFLGRRLSYVYEVKEFSPRERLVMATSDGPFAMETTYSWADAEGGGTRMRLSNRGEPSGFSSLLAPLIAPAVRRANRKDLARLKSILERPSAAS